MSSKQQEVKEFAQGMKEFGDQLAPLEAGLDRVSFLHQKFHSWSQAINIFSQAMDRCSPFVDSPDDSFSRCIDRQIGYTDRKN